MANTHHPKQNAFAPEFVADILQHALGSAGKPGVYGIVGLQGSGKSTLAAQMAALGKVRGLNIVVLSIDDFYFGKRERNALARKIHPLLATRGPPGTHDIELACTTLDRLKRGVSVAIPRFDKISDTRLPPSRWPKIAPGVDLLVFEGWCLFAAPEPAAQLNAPINLLERDRDDKCIWRRYCNHALADYVKLWRYIDRSLFLQGPGFGQVKHWRWQQEQSMQAARPNHKTMTRPELEDFIQLFERTSRQLFKQLPAIVDRTVLLDKNHRPES